MSVAHINELAGKAVPWLLAAIIALGGLVWNDMKADLRDGLDRQNVRLDLFLSRIQDMRDLQVSDHARLDEHERRLNSRHSPISEVVRNNFGPRP